MCSRRHRCRRSQSSYNRPRQKHPNKLSTLSHVKSSIPMEDENIKSQKQNMLQEKVCKCVMTTVQQHTVDMQLQAHTCFNISAPFCGCCQLFYCIRFFVLFSLGVLREVLLSLFEQNGRSNLAEEIQFLEFLLIQLWGRQLH